MNLINGLKAGSSHSLAFNLIMKILNFIQSCPKTLRNAFLIFRNSISLNIEVSILEISQNPSILIYLNLTNASHLLLTKDTILKNIRIETYQNLTKYTKRYFPKKFRSNKNYDGFLKQNKEAYGLKTADCIPLIL